MGESRSSARSSSRPIFTFSLNRKLAARIARLFRVRHKRNNRRHKRKGRVYLGKAAQGKARTNNLKRGEATLLSDQSQGL